MPCDTVQRSSVNLELKADNADHLIRALKSLGYQVQHVGERILFKTREGVNGIFADGKLTIQSAGNRYGASAAEKFDVNPIKKAYSVEVVKSTAKRFGWSLEQHQQDRFKFKVTKKGM